MYYFNEEYYWGGWKVKQGNEKQLLSNYSPNGPEAFCPDKTKNTWRYWNNNYWSLDETLSVKCIDKIYENNKKSHQRLGKNRKNPRKIAKNKMPLKKTQVQENNKPRKGHEVYEDMYLKNLTKPTNKPKLIGENSIGGKEEIIMSPEEIAMTSKEITMSPEEMPLSPEEITLSPEEITLSPEVMTMSPEEMLMSPEEMTMSSEEIINMSEEITKSHKKTGNSRKIQKNASTMRSEENTKSYKKLEKSSKTMKNARAFDRYSERGRPRKKQTIEISRFQQRQDMKNCGRVPLIQKLRLSKKKKSLMSQKFWV